MRHAFDADHIAAIDNTTRKLVAEGKRPLSVGILLLTRALIGGVRAGRAAELRHPRAEHPGPQWRLHPAQRDRDRSAPWSRGHSSTSSPASTWSSWSRSGRSSATCGAAGTTTPELEEQLAKRGLINRFLGPLARRVDAPWKMYPIGLLFGLGFDTATEIALLVLAGLGGGERAAVLRGAVAAAAVRGGHEPVRHRRRLLHELRLRLGVRPPAPQGVLQPDRSPACRCSWPSSSAPSRCSA